MPSRGEGFGLVYLEAMRFDKPCIASRVDGGSEVVDNGVTGLHVDPDNLDQMLSALVRLLRDDELAARLGRAGREKLDQVYRFEHFRLRLQERLATAVPGLTSPIHERDRALAGASR
jgi:glycosyltransferase involved in cell wall biosynthesis